MNNQGIDSFFCFSFFTKFPQIAVIQVMFPGNWTVVTVELLMKLFFFELSKMFLYFLLCSPFLCSGDVFLDQMFLKASARIDFSVVFASLLLIRSVLTEFEYMSCFVEWMQMEDFLKVLPNNNSCQTVFVRLVLNWLHLKPVHKNIYSSDSRSNIKRSPKWDTSKTAVIFEKW